PHWILVAQRLGLTADCFRSPIELKRWNHHIDRLARDPNPKGEEPRLPLYRRQFEKYARQLIEARPRRAAWVEPVPPKTTYNTPAPTSTSKGRTPRTTRFSQGRINQRRADLWAVHRFAQNKRGAKATEETLAASIAEIAAAFTGFDPLDPDSVTADDLG